jgi:hypothetical protein
VIRLEIKISSNLSTWKAGSSCGYPTKVGKLIGIAICGKFVSTRIGNSRGSIIGSIADTTGGGGPGC